MKQSTYITSIFVSTDDPEIGKISEEYGVKVPELRPAHLATDTSSIYDSINYILDRFEEKGLFFDFVILLEPTSPLRKKDDIDLAIKYLIKKSDTANSLVSVGEVQLEHPYYMQIIENDLLRPFIPVEDNYNQRQKLPKIFFSYGGIYLSKTETLRKSGTFYQEKTLPYIVERWQNYDINDIYDFIIVETILKKHMHEVV